LKFRDLVLITVVLLLAGYFLIQAVQFSVWNYNDSVYKVRTTEHEYNLADPKRRWDLPGELEEISGLSYYKHDQLACIQDEKGVLYLYDLTKGEIVWDAKFGGKGDYEGVEMVDETAFILRSDGEIFYFELGSDHVEKIETDLTDNNDAEGLGYSRSGVEFLIACKEQPGLKKEDLKNCRAVYRLGLGDREIKKQDRYLIDGESYNKMLEEKGLSKKKHKPFKPSGVAVHPNTGDIFVIGTVGKMLVVMNQNEEIIDMIPLDPKIFIQPEGVAFSPEGDLFISSEGKGQRGYILKF
jgi:uncharacterized protein YjiK